MPPRVSSSYLSLPNQKTEADRTITDTLDKSKVTGIDQVDNLQDGVNNLAAGQVGKGGLLQPVGDAFSKEGINRAERGGKDDSGSYGSGMANSAASGAKGASDTVTSGAKSAGDTAASGAQGAGGYVSGGLKSAGGYVGSLWGGKKEGEGEAEKK